MPLLHAAIFNALETLDDRLEHWYHLGIQGWSEKPHISPGLGRLIDVSGLSHKILADCNLPIPVNTDREGLKNPISSAADLNKMPPHMLSIGTELRRETLVRRLSMLQHIVAVTAPDIEGCRRKPITLQWTLVVKGTLDLSLGLRALGAPLRLMLCVSPTQREKILAFFGHPFT